MSTKGVAIVTGAAQGIGEGVALRLAADGFDIGLNDLSSETQVKKLQAVADKVLSLGRKVCIVPGDVSIDSVVEKMIKDVVANLGGVDVMVANAGHISVPASVVSMTTEQWDATLGINLRSVFLCYKFAAKQMIEQGRGGRLIGGSSLSGFSGVPMGCAYSASKAGIRVLTHSAARELGTDGITVNSYAPGIIATPLTLNNFGEEFLGQQKAACSLGDNGTPEDVAGLVSFLASKDSRFITGQTIMIDGGRLCI